MPRRPAEFIATAAGELGLVQRGKARAHHYGPDEKTRWHAMLAGVAAERGYKPGWVAYKHREKFGEWPATRNINPIKPTPEVLSWVRSRNIAFAKAKQRDAA
jgi:hypothetical protein